MALCCWQSANASHVMGAELSYTCVNNCTIQVEFSAYRSCSGAAFISPNSFAFVPQSPNCAVPTPLTAWSTQVVTELSPLCAAFGPTNCSNPASVINGVEEFYFTRMYDVCSAGACTFAMEWSTCCRNPSITNISNAGSQSIFIGATTFNNTLATCNNSPVFNGDPVPFICAGQSVVLDMSANDPEGDSLAYSLGPCFTTSSTNQVSYNAGYSPTQPMGPSWNVSLNPVNGQLTLVAQPGNVEVGNICLYVEEYRNGQLINTVMRDYVITVANCPPILCNGGNVATGTVYRDNNSNCALDAGDMGLAFRQILVLPDSVIIPTDAQGNYILYPDSGTYTLVQLPDPYGLWNQTCPPTLTYTLNFPGTGDTINGNDFGNEALFNCPLMWVDISRTITRPCFDNINYINYCNNGTDTAYSAYVEVTLDSNYTYTSSSVPVSSTNGDTYTFNLGDVAPGDCGIITLTAYLACDTSLLGNTICSEAHIYPDSSCFPASPNWDSSNVEILGYCDGDSLVCFTVYNTAGGNMAGPTDWRLYENGTLVANGTLQLCATCDTTMCFPANGNTIRLEVDQRPGHPSISTPSATVELCGQPNSANNLVNIFPMPDQDPYVSIHCAPAVAAYDPNSKYVYPSGVDAAFHYVDATDELEYQIDFQNLGTASAITVEITDTLSPNLDITTITPGVSSHAYTWQVLSDRRLQFTFDNINLVAAQQDSMLSMGFVKFKVKQIAGNSMGTRIENAADIVFDFNAPIRTNTVFNTIGWPVVIGLDLVPEAAAVKIYPNPATGEVFAEVEGLEDGKVLSFELYSIMGQKVMAGNFEAGNRYRADLQDMPRGVYIYRILDQDRMVKAGKLLLD